MLVLFILKNKIQNTKSAMKELIEYLAGFMTDARKDKIEEILSGRTRHLSVVLEDIYHPHNASAIIRNCECFGIQDMHVIEKKFEYTPNTDVVRGSLKWIDLHYHRGTENNSLSCVKHLKESGYKIAATCLREDSVTLDELPVDNKLALVLGTEETGVSDDILKCADYAVKIPMCGFTQSLNVSVSAAICIHELTSKLKSSDTNWQLTDTEKETLRLDWYKKSVRSLEHLLQRYEEKVKS